MTKLKKRIQENISSKSTILALSKLELTGKEPTSLLLQNAIHIRELLLKNNRMEDFLFLEYLPYLENKDISILKNLLV